MNNKCYAVQPMQKFVYGFKCSVYFLLPILLCSSCSGKTSTNLGNVFLNLSRQYTYIWQIIGGFCALMGVGLVMKSIFQFKIYGEQRTMMSSQHNIKLPLTLLLVGTVLIFVRNFIPIFMTSIFGSDNLLQWDNPSSFWDVNTMNALINLLRIIGFIAFIRGWLILVQNAGQGSHQAPGKAWTHIIGGILVINIVATKNILSNMLFGT